MTSDSQAVRGIVLVHEKLRSEVVSLIALTCWFVPDIEACIRD